ncbi:hypothetical protein [Nocardioides sp. W7]|uniref:hypothetical protein n=1 Tax=Nocardioides sp. W7 TaxID=2931390 RepID=UPI001FD37E25|nr:hypothetical protein [Nocardioides sp. W7]
MTDPTDQTDTADLGPMPEPEIEPGEPNPGGVDAIPETDVALPADLSTAENPAVDAETTPDEIQGGEDTSTEATKDGEDVPAEEESPA